jgi:CheY-like chemotaxis protein
MAASNGEVAKSAIAQAARDHGGITRAPSGKIFTPWLGGMQLTGVLQKLGADGVLVLRVEQVVDAALQPQPRPARLPRVTTTLESAKASSSRLSSSPLDGLAAFHQIRELDRSRRRRAPVVALTAHALREDRERCLAEGLDGYLARPLQWSLLPTRTPTTDAGGEESIVRPCRSGAGVFV